MILKVMIFRLVLGKHVRPCLEYKQTGGLVSGPGKTKPAFVSSPEVDGGSSFALPLGSSSGTLTGPSTLNKNKKLSVEWRALSWGRQREIIPWNSETVTMSVYVTQLCCKNQPGPMQIWFLKLPFKCSFACVCHLYNFHCAYMWFVLL